MYRDYLYNLTVGSRVILPNGTEATLSSHSGEMVNLRDGNDNEVRERGTVEVTVIELADRNKQRRQF